MFKKDTHRTLPYNPRLFAIAILTILISLSFLAACQIPQFSPLAAATNTPVREITALLALLGGRLNLVDGCLVVEEKPGDTYSLAWVPNLQATIEGDTVRVKTGMVVGGTGEEILKIGKIYYFGGGYVGLDEYTKTTLPSHCPPPYFAVNRVVGESLPTQKPVTPRPTFTPIIALPETPYP